jgi:ABC-type multidrug transport system fused ATPase/permease subunit
MEQPARKPILNQLSFTMEPREFVAVISGIGSGKSTLMKLHIGCTMSLVVLYKPKAMYDIDEL